MTEVQALRKTPEDDVPLKDTATPSISSHHEAGQRAPAGGNFLRTLTAVLWSFIGIRKNSEFQKDAAQIKPLHILAVGVVLALIFVITLIVLVNVVVAS
jgi:amino acid transporter